MSLCVFRVMKYIFIIISIINLFFVVGLIVYYPLIYLNITFTNDELRVADVPFYDTDLGSGTTRRYQYHWWEFASDSLRILEPIVMITAMCSQVIFGPQSVLPLVVFMSFMVILETAKLVKRAADWLRCGGYQFCRNFDTSSPADRPNYIFLTCFFFNLVYWIFAIIYLALLPKIQKTSEAKKEKKEKEKFLDRIKKRFSRKRKPSRVPSPSDSLLNDDDDDDAGEEKMISRRLLKNNKRRRKRSGRRHGKHEEDEDEDEDLVAEIESIYTDYEYAMKGSSSRYHNGI